jgi:hypothetical protein
MVKIHYRPGCGKALLRVGLGTPSEEKGVIDAVLDGNKGAQEARTLWNLKETWNLTLTGEGSSAGAGCSSRVGTHKCFASGA